MLPTPSPAGSLLAGKVRHSRLRESLRRSTTDIKVRPRIAKSYPEILKAFDSKDANLVYVGSFVQAIIAARKLGTPLAQNVNGKEFYSGVLIVPKGVKPQDVLNKTPEKIAFAPG